MPSVPQMTQAPANSSFQAVIPLVGSPGVVKKRPSCKSGMARSASLAQAEVAATSSAASAPRNIFKLDGQGRRERNWVIMTGEVSLNAFGMALNYHPRIEVRAGRQAQ